MGNCNGPKAITVVQGGAYPGDVYYVNASGALRRIFNDKTQNINVGIF